MSREETTSTTPFSTQTFHASAGVVLDTDNIVDDPNVDDRLGPIDVYDASKVATSSTSRQADRYNKLKARTRSRRPNNAIQHQKKMTSGTKIVGGKGIGNDENSKPVHIRDTDGHTSKIEMEVEKSSDPEMELDKENVEIGRNMRLSEERDIRDVPTSKNIVAEKIGIVRKITSHYGEGDFDDFIRQLKREVASEHKELWDSFQIVAGFDSPSTMSPLWVDTEMDNRSEHKKPLLDGAAKQKLASINKHLRNKSHKSNITKDIQIVNDRRMKRERAAHRKVKDDDSKRSGNDSNSSMGRKERRKQKKEQKKAKKKEERVKQKNLTHRISSDGPLKEKKKAPLVPPIIDVMASALPDLPEEDVDMIRSTSEEELLSPNTSEIGSQPNSKTEKRGSLVDYLNRLKPVSNCIPGKVPSEAASSNASNYQLPPRPRALRGRKDWLASLREKQKEKQKRLPKGSLKDDDDDRSVTTVDLEHSAQDAVGRSTVISIFGKKVALSQTSNESLDGNNSIHSLSKNSPWQVKLRPVLKQTIELNKRQPLDNESVPKSKNITTTVADRDAADERVRLENDRSMIGSLPLGSSAQMPVSSGHIDNSVDPGTDTCMDMNESSSDDDVQTDIPDEYSSITPGSIIDLSHLPVKEFKCESDVTIVPITNNKDNRRQVVVLGRHLLLIASLCSRRGENDEGGVVKELANVLWHTRRDEIVSLNLNNRADGVMISIKDGTTFPLNFENCTQCVSFIQTYTGIDSGSNSNGSIYAEKDPVNNNEMQRTTQSYGDESTNEIERALFDFTTDGREIGIDSNANFPGSIEEGSSLQVRTSVGEGAMMKKVSPSSRFTEDEIELIVKLRKMLKYNTSEDAVRYKMDLDNVATKVREAVFDNDITVESPKESMKASLENHLSNKSGSKSLPSGSTHLSEEDEKIASKYRKMLKVGMPKEIVEHAMKRDQVNNRIVSVIFQEEALNQSPTTKSGDSKRIALEKHLKGKLGLETAVTGSTQFSEEDEKIASKYRKMLKVGMPKEVVEHAMKRDQVKDSIACAVLGDREPAQSPSDDERTVARFRKMLQMGISSDAVHNKMKLENVSESIVKKVLDTSSTIKQFPPKIMEREESLTAEEKKIAAKFKKMLTMGIPPPAVRHAMTKDKVSSHIVAVVLGEEETKDVSKNASAVVLTESERALVEKFKKMGKVGLPEEVVRHEMRKQNVPQKIMNCVFGNKSSSKSSMAIISPKKRKNDLMTFHWEKLSEDKVQNNQTIWTRSAKKLRLSPIRIDMGELEQYFTKQTKPKKSSNRSKGEGEKGKEMAKLLDINRAQNISISLQAFKQFSLDELVSIIGDVDPENKIQGDRVLFLKGLLPRKEESDAVKKYQGHESKLVLAEKFFRKLLPVTRVPAKIKVIETMEMFNQNSEEVASRFMLLKNTCRDVMRSEKLQYLLDAVLAIGNIMNEGTRSGDAAGIKFSSLLKLSQTKSKDGKTSVLDYIVSWFIGKGEKENLNLTKDIPHCSEASRILITDVESSFTTLESSMKICKTELSKYKSEQLSDGKRFSSGTLRMSDFINTASARLIELQKNRDETKKSCKELADYVGEDGGERAATDVLLILNELMTNINLATDKYERMKETEARKEAARKRRESSQVKSAGKKEALKGIAVTPSLPRRALFGPQSDGDDTELQKAGNANPRQDLLQSIRKKDALIPPHNKKADVTIDPRSALLQSIQKRKDSTNPPPHETTSDGIESRSALLNSIQKRKISTKHNPVETADDAIDPRSALFQSIERLKDSKTTSDTSDPRKTLLLSIQKRKDIVSPPSDITADDDGTNEIQSRPINNLPQQEAAENSRKNLLLAIRQRAKKSETSSNASSITNDLIVERQSQKLRVLDPQDEDDDTSSVTSSTSTSASDFLSVRGCGIIPDWARTRVNEPEKPRQKKNKGKKRFSGDVAAAAAAAVAAAQAAMQEAKRNSTNGDKDLVNSAVEAAAIAAAKASLETSNKNVDSYKPDVKKSTPKYLPPGTPEKQSTESTAKLRIGAMVSNSDDLKSPEEDPAFGNLRANVYLDEKDENYDQSSIVREESGTEGNFKSTKSSIEDGEITAPIMKLTSEIMENLTSKTKISTDGNDDVEEDFAKPIDPFAGGGIAAAAALAATKRSQKS